VRELENVIERIVVLAASEEVTDADLPEEIRTSLPPVRDAFLLDLPEQGISLEAVERELLMRALEKFNGNQTQAARYLDISRRTLIYRMEKHGLSREGEVA
jgi:two-component system NtrC family response regulator